MDISTEGARRSTEMYQELALSTAKTSCSIESNLRDLAVGYIVDGICQEGKKAATKLVGFHDGGGKKRELTAKTDRFHWG